MIFDKANNGSAEMKELIGFIHKSIEFDNVAPYIQFAERDLKKIIGTAVWDVAQEHYESDNYHAAAPGEGEEALLPEWAILDELVALIQRPVALHAYRRFATSNDLSHSPAGRRMFSTEKEKMPFEWMIEKDNENLVSLAMEATDMLLEFLDLHLDTRATPDQGEEEGDILIPWGTSAEYEATKRLFINTADEFDQIFPIGRSRSTFLALVPFLERVQKREIRSCLTADQFDDLLEAIVDDDLSANDKTLLSYIRPALALLALSTAVKRLSAQLLPDGIFVNVVTGVVKGRNQTSKTDRNEVSLSLEKDGLRELARLQEYLKKLAATAGGEAYAYTLPADTIDETLKFVSLP